MSDDVPDELERLRRRVADLESSVRELKDANRFLWAVLRGLPRLEGLDDAALIASIDLGVPNPLWDSW